MPLRFMVVLCLCGMAVGAQSSGIWIDVPFVKQEKEGCGAASVAMVMQYWAADAAASNPESIRRALYSSQAHGIYASDLERYFHEHAFTTSSFRGTWDDLRQHLEKGRPLIVALKPLASGSGLHYVVVVGVDWRHNVVQINDAAQRKLLKEDRDRFEKEWKGAGKWTLLAMPQPPAGGQ